MKLFFGKKEEKVIKLFSKHLEKVEEGLNLLTELIEFYVTNDMDKSVELSKQISNVESQADTLRRKTESEMYQGAFLPNFRGELLELIEAVDKVMNKTQTVSEILVFQKPKIPEDFREDFLKQCGLVKKTYKFLKKSIENVFENIEKSGEYIQKVELHEHEEDILEKDMLRRLFEINNLELCEKLQLKDLFLQIGDIADKAEDASDKLEIIVLKRNIK
ncbi:MAG: uncharacterized protein PWQ66_785 [Petrotoga sp.]|nr:uncharacterized protein [Petrotoga sp.]